MSSAALSTGAAPPVHVIYPHCLCDSISVMMKNCAMDSLAFFNIIVSYVVDYRYLGYWVVFFASFLEAIPFSGLIIPGNILLVVAGILSYEGYLDTYDMLFLAVLGAILGDVAGYYIGAFYRNGRKNISEMERGDRYPFKKRYLEKTERFFEKHGGKSVFFGRFIGPLRPFVPFFAGASKMPLGRFMYYNIASALLWAFGFFFLGYLFEGSMRIVKRIEHIVLVIAIVGALSWAVHAFVKKKTENGQSQKKTFDN